VVNPDDPIFSALAKIEAARNEIVDLHKSKDRLTFLQQQVTSLKRRLEISDHQASLIKSFYTPSVSGDESGSEHAAYTTIPSLTTPSPAVPATATTSVPDILNLSSTEKSSSTNTFITPSPSPSHKPSGLEPSLPTPFATPSLTPASTPLVGVYHSRAAPQPTPNVPSSTAATTVSTTNAFADPKLYAELSLLQQKVSASERSRKRMLEELDGMWNQRVDKDRRYKKLMAVACNVPVEKVDEMIMPPPGM
jgi:hypothetical protein